MKIGKLFNQLSKSQYIHYIYNRKKYTDFNTLGLYRSICENEKLTLTEKIEIRDYANTIFGKTFTLSDEKKQFKRNQSKLYNLDYGTIESIFYLYITL